MVELKEYNNKKLASAKFVYDLLEIKRVFSDWIKTSISNADLKENEDFYKYIDVSIRENQLRKRKFTDYLLTEKSAIIIITMSRSKKAISIRKMVIKAFQQKQNLELITPRQAALAYEYINFFKYIDNQKKVYKQHQKAFISSNPLSKYIYSEFAEYREKITGWNKTKLDIALIEYLKTSSGINFTKLMKKSMSNKLSVIDVNEAIRVSVLDLLYSKGTNEELAVKFSNMIKNVSKEMQTLAYQKNENNLFQQKEIMNLKSII